METTTWRIDGKTYKFADWAKTKREAQTKAGKLRGCGKFSSVRVVPQMGAYVIYTYKR